MVYSLQYILLYAKQEWAVHFFWLYKGIDTFYNRFDLQTCYCNGMDSAITMQPSEGFFFFWK